MLFGNVDKEILIKNLQNNLILNAKDFLFIKKNNQNQKKPNNISINVFRYEDETPYCIYTSKRNFEKHVDLLLLSNSKNPHYVL